jgi:hypothetical protein
MKILGYYIKDNIIINSDGEYCDKRPYLSFLIERKPDTIRLFNYLYESVKGITKILNWNDKITNRLIITNKLNLSPYKFVYYPYKFFSIKKSNYLSVDKTQLTYYGDLSQYINKELSAEYTRDIGQEIYDVLVELGLSPTNLISPYKQFSKKYILENNQIEKHLEQLYHKYDSTCSIVKRNVLNQIIYGLNEYRENKT